MIGSFIGKCALAGAVAAITLGAGTPATAGGWVSYGYYGPAYYGGYHYAGYRHYGHRGYYRGHGYRRGHHYRRHRHGHGGNGAAIALGVIGGAIILNELAEDRARDRYYRDRYYDGYYDGRRAGARDDYYDDRYRLRSQPLDDGYAGEEELPPENYGGAGVDADLEDRLDGGPEPIRLSYREAYDSCVGHAREALADRDFVLAAPSRPETADDIGGAWKMTANVTARNRQGEQWTRAMYCEADEARVYMLELI